eukprot:6174521-Pleurochrysis_carterae.AAC.5
MGYNVLLAACHDKPASPEYLPQRVVCNWSWPPERVRIRSLSASNPSPSRRHLPALLEAQLLDPIRTPCPTLAARESRSRGEPGAAVCDARGRGVLIRTRTVHEFGSA